MTSTASLPACLRPGANTADVTVRAKRLAHFIRKPISAGSLTIDPDKVEAMGHLLGKWELVSLTASRSRNPKGSMAYGPQRFHSGVEFKAAGFNQFYDLMSGAEVFDRQEPDFVVHQSGDNSGIYVGPKVGPDNPDTPMFNTAHPYGTRYLQEPIARLFVDSDFALEHILEIYGWSDNLVANHELGCFMDRRYLPDEINARASDAVMELIDEHIDLASISPTINASVVGGSPRVGRYLAGSPNCMNRLEYPISNEGPVRIFTDLSCIGGAIGGTGDLEQRQVGRGVAILALARAVQKLRPVELWATTQGTARTRCGQDVHTIFAIRIGIAPFDVGAASRALCDPFMGTGFCYRGEMRMVGIACGARGRLGGSPIPFSITCGAKPGWDIVIPAINISGASVAGVHYSMADWVKGQLTAWLESSGHIHESEMLKAMKNPSEAKGAKA